MRTRATISRVLSFWLRSFLVVIAFLGLLSTAILQTVKLERAASREALLRAELLRERAESNSQKARSAVDQLFTQIEEQRTAAGTPRAELQREILERALLFYQEMEPRTSSPEEKARVLERVKQIRSVLGDKANERKS
jgi:hypothetical protein